MNVNDDDLAEVSPHATSLELLRQHATDDGEVDMAALLASGVDLRQLRPALEQLRRARRLLLEFDADRVDRIILLGQARRNLPPSSSNQ